MSQHWNQQYSYPLILMLIRIVFVKSRNPCPGPSLTFMAIFRLYFKGHSNKWSLTSTSIIRYSLVELNLKAWSFQSSLVPLTTRYLCRNIGIDETKTVKSTTSSAAFPHPHTHKETLHFVLFHSSLLPLLVGLLAALQWFFNLQCPLLSSTS